MMDARLKKGLFFAGLFLIPTTLCFLFYYFIVRKPLVTKDIRVFRKLEYFGEKKVVEKTDSTGKKIQDTAYYQVPEFVLTNQDGKSFGSANLKGKIYVVDFFFASCKTICPKLATHLILVQKKMEYMRKQFGIVSITVDPANDTPKALKAYAYKVHANPEIWNLLTGDKNYIYNLAQNGFLLNAREDTSKALPDFIHSERFLLIDQDRHIRGIYDGTSTVESTRLMDEIKVLATEYKFKRKL